MLSDMLGIDYEEVESKIKSQMGSDSVSVEMKKALLLLDIGLQKVRIQELQESIEE